MKLLSTAGEDAMMCAAAQRRAPPQRPQARARRASTTSRRAALLLAACITGVACAHKSEAAAVRDLAGTPHRPTQPIGDAVHVLVFISTECPIANSYAPTLRALHAAWRTEPRVQLFLAHVDPDLTVEDARRHAEEYALPGTVVLDPDHCVVESCGATITPEAVVWTSQGQTYRGRIDDQWRKLGSRAAVASTQDLAVAVRCTLAGEPVPEPFPAAIGCSMPQLAR